VADAGRAFREPSPLERFFNRAFGALVGMGLGPRDYYLSNEIVLKRGSSQRRFRLRALADADKPPVLLAYLERFRSVVQRYFPVPAGSPARAFAEIAARYPVFELQPTGDTEERP
jgi:hypothetical protein